MLLQGSCLLYTSDAADDLLCVDLGGRRIIKKKNKKMLLLGYRTHFLGVPSHFENIYVEP